VCGCRFFKVVEKQLDAPHLPRFFHMVRTDEFGTAMKNVSSRGCQVEPLDRPWRHRKCLHAARRARTMRAGVLFT
jgi:hypothetical protein